MKKHREYAAASFRKDQRVNVRISSRDLDALRKRALSEGIPYQTLIASVLHRFIGRSTARAGGVRVSHSTLSPHQTARRGVRDERTVSV